MDQGVDLSPTDPPVDTTLPPSGTAPFRTIQEQSIDGVMMLESVRGPDESIVDFQWTYANEAAARIVGRPREWFVGRKLLEEMPGNREDGLFDAYVRVVETGERWTHELSYAHDGLDIFIRLVAVKVDQGFAVSFTDLSERRRAEALVARSEQRFRAAVEAVNGILWTNNAAGEMQGEQPAWSALTGQTPEEYQGYGWSSAVHPDDAQPTIDAWNAAVFERRPFEFEHRVRRHDDIWRDFLVRAVPILTGDGEIEEWVGVHSDVTDQRKAERQLVDFAATLEEQVDEATHELRAREARMRSIFETSYQYFAELAPDGTLLDANETSLAGIGQSLSDVVGLPFWDTPWFAATPKAPETIKAIVARVTEGETVSQEIDVALPAGRRSFEFSMRPVRDATGSIVSLIPEALDITERRLAEERLRQSLKLESIGQLTGGVAHDFNNLLTVVIGNLELLGKHVRGDAKAMRLIDGALAGAERGATLTQRLLAFARRQDLKVEATDIGALVEDMAPILEKSAGAGIEMQRQIDRDLPLAMVDANQLELALLNLVVNARDAMPDGGALSISVRRAGPPPGSELSDPDYLVLSVADTGKGMDSTVIARAIEPFFSTKEPGKGTGLGLSMIHGLAVQMNGAFRLDSAPGVGTTAEIWLPVTWESPRPPETETRPEVNDMTTPIKATVLLVEDDALIAMSTVDMLEDLGHVVIEANSGAAALEILRSNQPVDVVITDYSMPKMTGVQLAREVRTLWPDLPILLATGYAELPEGTEMNLPRLGKPYLQDQLATEIAKLVRQ